MEIKGLGGPPGPTGLTKTPKKVDNNSFREALQVRIAQTGPPSRAGAAESAASPIARGERLLGLLDDFAQALADPHKSLKEMEPLVKRVEGELKDLEIVSSTETGMDQGLARLVSEVKLLGHVTLFKFQRGDFV